MAAEYKPSVGVMRPRAAGGSGAVSASRHTANDRVPSAYPLPSGGHGHENSPPRQREATSGQQDLAFPQVRTVEVAGIEPASGDAVPGILRVQPAVIFSAPTVTQASRGRAQSAKSPGNPTDEDYQQWLSR